MAQIFEVNRSAFIVTPKQAFFDMLAPVMRGQIFEAEDPKEHDSSTVYLVSADFLDPDEAMKYLKKNYKLIFEREIEGWITDPDLWPDKVTWKQFNDWFSVTFQSMIFDMASDEPVYEEDMLEE